MTSIALRLASAALIASLLAVGTARADEGSARAASESCGRTASLEAAKNALARGARTEALEHLRRAEQLLDACSRTPEGTTPDQAPEHSEPALALVVETILSGPLS